MKLKSHTEKGIALIQVLLMCAIMSVLALYLSTTAREQIQVSQWTSDKAEAFIAAKNAESLVVYALLTEPLDNFISPEQQLTDFYLADKWNLHGEAFNVTNSVSVKIQDQGGLINLHYPEPDLLKSVFQLAGLDESGANQLHSLLLDWQDIDSIPRAGSYDDESYRNGPITTLHELELIDDKFLALRSSILPNVTLYRSNNFNPLNASFGLLSAITNAAIAGEVTRLRRERMLSPLAFTQLTNIRESDNIYFYPSNYFEVSITGKVNDSRVKKTKLLKIEPRAQTQTPLDVMFTVN